MAQKKSKWAYALLVIVVLTVLSFFLAGIISLFVGNDFESLDGNVAIIDISGPIVSQSVNLFMQDVTSADDIRKLIRKADRNEKIKAIVFEINSPGGSAVASDEIAIEIKKINKTTVGWIREIGTSGAYWIASSTDHIVANRMSITGSIGVIASYLGFSGFLEGHNVTYERLVSGEFKDMGSPFKDLTPEERMLFEKSLNDIHDDFVGEVAENRNLNKKDVQKIATGAFYLGARAKDMGLVDELGSRDEVKSYVEKRIGEEVNFIRYSTGEGLFSILTKAMHGNFFYIGRGIGDSFFAKSGQPQSITITT
jgi:protease IV